MNPRNLGYGLIIAMLLVNPLSAQQAASLPDIVKKQIDHSTIALIRMNLQTPASSMISKFMGGLPDPASSNGDRASRLQRTLKKLAELRVKEVDMVISVTDPSLNGATLVIPISAESEREAVVKLLSGDWKNGVSSVDGGVIVNNESSRPGLSKITPQPRTDLEAALNEVSGSEVQIAFGMGTDVRRTLVELLPTLPEQLGGQSIRAMTDGLNWAAAGISVAPKGEFRFIAQGKDAVAAESLEKMIKTTIQASAKLAKSNQVISDSNSIIELLSPSRSDSRISLTLSDPASARLANEIVVPLLAKVDSTARQSQSVDHLKHLMLAMHNYHDKFKAFPRQGNLAPDGRKLLSWRVHLLPFLDEPALYREFHLDEPWDSEHNQKLIARMPSVFASGCVTNDQIAKGMTGYLGLVGKNMAFGTDEPIDVRKITDGTSNTIAIVDANSDRAVIWTKPDDLNVNLEKPLQGLAGENRGRFWVAFWDGSVRSIVETIDPKTLALLFQYKDGTPIPAF